MQRLNDSKALIHSGVSPSRPAALATFNFYSISFTPCSDTKLLTRPVYEHAYNVSITVKYRRHNEIEELLYYSY